jgi:hypothetical protein
MTAEREAAVLYDEIESLLNVLQGDATKLLAASGGMRGAEPQDAVDALRAMRWALTEVAGQRG